MANAIRLLAGALGERPVLAEVFAVDPGEPALIETSEGIWEAGRGALRRCRDRHACPELGILIRLSCHARDLPCLMPGSPRCRSRAAPTVRPSMRPFPGEHLYAVGLAGDGARCRSGPRRGLWSSG